MYTAVHILGILNIKIYLHCTVFMFLGGRKIINFTLKMFVKRNAILKPTSKNLERAYPDFDDSKQIL